MEPGTGILITLLINSIKLAYDAKQNTKKEENKLLKSIYDNFEKVHDSYLESFRKYRDSINNDPLNLSSVVELIENDVSNYRHLIDKLSISSQQLIDNDVLFEFTEEICRYLDYPGSIFYKSIEPFSNIKRMSLIEALNFINILTPEVMISSGFSTDIESIKNNQIKYEISSLQLIQRDFLRNNSSFIDEQKLIEVTSKCDDIKRYLAKKCIEFITKKTQDAYYLVTDAYLHLEVR